MPEPKKAVITLNSLMRHMRESGIEISGSAEKQQLLLIGYFHGYKGYRYTQTPENRIPFSGFSQLVSIVDFDSEIKAALYRPVMQLETALKSIATEEILKAAQSESLNIIMEKLMHAEGHKKASDYRKRKYQVRDMIHASLTEAYSNKRGHIVSHYYNADKGVPIWAIFETITLGQFARFIDLLDPAVKIAISEHLKIPLNLNTNGALLPKIIYLLQDVRNAIAHNNVIFDGRHHKTRAVDQTIRQYISSLIGIRSLDFSSIVDDILLIFVLLTNLQTNKNVLINSVERIANAFTEVYTHLGASLYMRIIPNDSQNKLRSLIGFIRKS